jgi:hypothetical protein
MPYPRIILPPFDSADGPAVTTPASLTDATPVPVSNIPANWLHRGGMVFVDISGRFTSTATPGTLTIGLYLAKTGVAIASAVNIVNSAALVPLASQTNKTFGVRLRMEVSSHGPGGAGIGQVRAWGICFGLVAAGSVDMVPATAPMTAVTVDTTVDQQVRIGLTPSVTTGSVTLHNCAVEYSGD